MKKFVVLAAAAGAVYMAGGQHGITSVGHAFSAAAVPSGPIAANSNEALANQMASAYGWTGGQATCLDELWTHESGFSATADNTSSGAFGIPQALPADTMASAGADWQTTPAPQVKWGLSYIRDRYGTPCGAWNFEMSHSPNWY